MQFIKAHLTVSDGHRLVLSSVNFICTSGHANIFRHTLKDCINEVIKQQATSVTTWRSLPTKISKYGHWEVTANSCWSRWYGLCHSRPIFEQDKPWDSKQMRFTRMWRANFVHSLIFFGLLTVFCKLPSQASTRSWYSQFSHNHPIWTWTLSYRPTKGSENHILMFLENCITWVILWEFFSIPRY